MIFGVIHNTCQMQPHVISFYGVTSRIGFIYPGTEGKNNRQGNHQQWHATNSSERTQLSCWCLLNHKGCTYRIPVRCVTKTWGIVLLNKKKHILLSEVYYVWQVVKTPIIISNNPVFERGHYVLYKHWCLAYTNNRLKLNTTETEHHQYTFRVLGENSLTICTQSHFRCYPCDRLKPATRIPPKPATPNLQHTSKQEHTTNVVTH